MMWWGEKKEAHKGERQIGLGNIAGKSKYRNIAWAKFRLSRNRGEKLH